MFESHQFIKLYITTKPLHKVVVCVVAAPVTPFYMVLLDYLILIQMTEELNVVVSRGSSS
jgi:hypothetical protein